VVLVLLVALMVGAAIVPDRLSLKPQSLTDTYLPIDIDVVRH
jgi:hypothetical protein